MRQYREPDNGIENPWLFAQTAFLQYLHKDAKFEFAKSLEQSFAMIQEIVGLRHSNTNPSDRRDNL